jgi:hypothetical protein
LQELSHFDIDHDLLLTVAGSIPENHDVNRVHSSIAFGELGDGFFCQCFETRTEFTRWKVLRMVTTKLRIDCRALTIN